MKAFPVPTKELQCYTYLRGRRKLSGGERRTHQILHKGYIGEKKFATLIQQKLDNNYIALYGVLLENKGTLYQIDCLLIFPNQLLLIEIRYFQGEFEFKEDGLYDFLQQKTYRNPLHQMKRSRLLFQDLLSKLRVNLHVHPQLVFNHHQFTLFHAPRQTSIVLPTQLHTFMEQLANTSGVLQPFHYQLAKQIKKRHIRESPYERLPNYKYGKLQKGVHCYQCRKKMNIQYRELSCNHCSYREVIDSGILRNTIEFQVLFPSEKIKTGIIAEWCGGMFSTKTISRILKNYLKLHPNTSDSYYVFIEEFD